MKINSLFLIVFFLLSQTSKANLQNLDAPQIEKYLELLDKMPSEKSKTFSINIFGSLNIGNTLNSKLPAPLRNFTPLFESIIELVKRNERLSGREISHIAIRLDTNGLNKKDLDKDRVTTSDWHEHEGSDRYIFALSRNQRLATQIMNEGVAEFIAINELFYLRGSMRHRSPPADIGNRIQLSIGVIELPPQTPALKVFKASETRLLPSLLAAPYENLDDLELSDDAPLVIGKKRKF